VRRRREGAKDVEREGWLGREDGRRVDWGRRGVGCWEDWRAREPEDEERFIASSLKGVFFAWEERGSSGLVVSKFGVWRGCVSSGSYLMQGSLPSQLQIDVSGVRSCTATLAKTSTKKDLFLYIVTTRYLEGLRQVLDS